MKYFCINLPAQKERYIHCQNEFKKAQLDVAIVSAFPAGLSQMAYMLNRLNKGMLGCYISHERLIEEILRNDYGICVIFEDDIKLVANFSVHIDKVTKSLPEDWDIAFLGWGGSVTFLEEVIDVSEINGQSWLKLEAGSMSGFYGYMINGKKSAAKILPLLHPIKKQIDVQVSDAVKKRYINGYVLKNPIVLHPSIFKTTVQRNNVKVN